MNAGLKQYLQFYINFNQDDWVQFLPTAEFEANLAVNKSTTISPFEATKGYIPKSGFEPPAVFKVTGKAKSEVAMADTIIKRTSTISDQLKEKLKCSQALMKHHTDKKRMAAPLLEVNDQVMVDSRFIKTTQPSKSIDQRNLGPFRILKVVNYHSYMLDLPDSMKIFPVSHPWLLHLHKAALLWVETLEWLRLSGLSLFDLVSSFLLVCIYF
jgi:hypothetical protein